MTLLRGKSMRVFLSQAGMTDLTENLRAFDTQSAAFTLLSIGYLYLGNPHKFNNRYVSVTTTNTNSCTLSAEYWDGTNWVAFTDLIDETSAFAQSGWIQWEEKSAWQKNKPAVIAGLSSLAFEQELFWIRLKVSADTSAMSLQTIAFLLSDDRLMKTIYPEIDSYLPTGQTTWFAQHDLAKNSIVNELIVRGSIAYEEQIKNPEDWLLAASYRCIELILAPIQGDQRLNDVAKKMGELSEQFIKIQSASLDKNKNEDLDESEKEPSFSGSIDLNRR